MSKKEQIESLAKTVCFLERQLDVLNKRLCGLSNWGAEADKRLSDEHLELRALLANLDYRLLKLEKRKDNARQIESLKKQLSNHQDILDKAAHPRSEFKLEIQSKFDSMSRTLLEFRQLVENCRFNYDEFDKRIEQLEIQLAETNENEDSSAETGLEKNLGDCLDGSFRTTEDAKQWLEDFKDTGAKQGGY